MNDRASSARRDFDYLDLTVVGEIGRGELTGLVVAIPHDGDRLAVGCPAKFLTSRVTCVRIDRCRQSSQTIAGRIGKDQTGLCDVGQLISVGRPGVNSKVRDAMQGQFSENQIELEQRKMKILAERPGMQADEVDRLLKHALDNPLIRKDQQATQIIS